MHRDTKEGRGSREGGNIQHLRERNERHSLGGPQLPEQQEEWGTKDLFRRVRENCWSGGLKLVSLPPKMRAVSAQAGPGSSSVDALLTVHPISVPQGIREGLRERGLLHSRSSSLPSPEVERNGIAGR